MSTYESAIAGATSFDGTFEWRKLHAQIAQAAAMKDIADAIREMTQVMKENNVPCGDEYIEFDDPAEYESFLRGYPPYDNG